MVWYFIISVSDVVIFINICKHITFLNSRIENKEFVLENSLEVLCGEFIVIAVADIRPENLLLNSG